MDHYHLRENIKIDPNKKSEIETKKAEINKKYNRASCTVAGIGVLSLLLSLGTAYWGRIRENPYSNSATVIKYQLTSEELEKIKTSRKQLGSLQNNLFLYMEPPLRSELKKLDESLSNEEERIGKELGNFRGNPELQKYEARKNAEDLKPWLRSLLGIGLFPIIPMGIIRIIKKKKLSKLEQKVA